MDYGHILKRAWAVTWKHKILWLFGLFMMAGGANFSGSSSGTQSTSGPGEMTAEQLEAFSYATDQFLAWLPIIIGVGIVILIIAIVWWVFSIAANGALIHLVNEAEERREVRAGLGWRAGFHNWGRVFAIYFLLMLPLLVLGIIAAAVFFMMLAAAGGNAEELLAGLLVSCCCMMVVFILLGLVIGFFITILGMLGTRHAVLDDIGPIDALKAAWTDMRTRFKDVFLMWLISIGVGIAYSMVMGFVFMFFGFGMFLLFFTGAVWASAIVGLGLFLIMLVPNAIYQTFVSAMWTTFFRSLTGRDVLEVREARRVPPVPEASYPPAPPQPAEGGYAPPTPTAPGGYSPPAPPATPEGYPPATPPQPGPGG